MDISQIDTDFQFQHADAIVIRDGKRKFIVERKGSFSVVNIKNHKPPLCFF